MRPAVRIQIVNQYDLLGLREVDVAQIAQHFRIVDGRAPFGDLDMTPAFERREKHEHIDQPLRLYS